MPHHRAENSRELCVLLPRLGERAGVRASVSSNLILGGEKSRLVPSKSKKRASGCHHRAPSASSAQPKTSNIQHRTSNIELSTPTNTSALNSQGAKTPRRGGKEPTDVPMKQCHTGLEKSPGTMRASPPPGRAPWAEREQIP